MPCLALLVPTRCQLLAYLVRLQVWLPVALVQGRIEKEIVANLAAVRRYVEGQVRAGTGSALPQPGSP